MRIDSKLVVICLRIMFIITLTFWISVKWTDWWSVEIQWSFYVEHLWGTWASSSTYHIGLLRPLPLVCKVLCHMCIYFIAGNKMKDYKKTHRGHGCFSLLNVCAVSFRSLRRADPSSRGVLPTVVCVRVWSSENKQPRHLLWVGRRGKDYEYLITNHATVVRIYSIQIIPSW
jgi:hypothetical protein